MVIKWSDGVNIRQPWWKGHSIFAPPSGGPRWWELLRHGWFRPPCCRSAPEVDGTEAREETQFAKAAPLHRCALTQFPLLAPNVQTAAWQLRGINATTPRLRWSGINVRLWATLRLPLSFDLTIIRIYGDVKNLPAFADFLICFHAGWWKQKHWRCSPSFYCQELNLQPFSSWFKERRRGSLDMWRATHRRSLLRHTLTTALADRRFMVIDSIWCDAAHKPMSGVSMVTLPCIQQPRVLWYFTFFPCIVGAVFLDASGKNEMQICGKAETQMFPHCLLISFSLSAWQEKLRL